LVDGSGAFPSDESQFTKLKYIVAKTAGCRLGKYMEQSGYFTDRWLQVWAKAELLSYAGKVTDIEKDVVEENMQYLGGIARYAFERGQAKKIADNAVTAAGPV
jgi:hypothetical protein